MSGAEASLVIGLISAIISIIDTTKKVYDAAENVSGLPQAFHEVAQRLPIVQDTLKIAEADVRARNLNKEQSDIKKGILEACKDKATRLEGIFQKVMPAADASRIDRYYKAVRILGKGKAVEDLMKGLLVDMQLLAGNQVGGLSEAIAELSSVAPSVLPSIPDHAPDTHTNTGSGPQNIHEGSGNLNSNSGSGRQYNAEVQNFTG
jgi:hypothetical protein